MDALPPHDSPSDPPQSDPSQNAFWTPELKAEFVRRRRKRNIALLLGMIALCLLIYAIAVVKLAKAGHMW